MVLIKLLKWFPKLVQKRKKRKPTVDWVHHQKGKKNIKHVFFVNFGGSVPNMSSGSEFLTFLPSSTKIQTTNNGTTIIDHCLLNQYKNTHGPPQPLGSTNNGVFKCPPETNQICVPSCFPFPWRICAASRLTTPFPATSPTPTNHDQSLHSHLRGHRRTRRHRILCRR